MSGDPNHDAAWVRSLVRSARVDSPPRGAVARARARLGVDEGAPPVHVVLTGALLLAIATFTTASHRAVSSSHEAREATPADCGGDVEAPPRSCMEALSSSRFVGPSTGSSSGMDLSRGVGGG